MGSRGRSGRAENLVSTGIRSRTVQPGSSVAIPTELPGHKYDFPTEYEITIHVLTYLLTYSMVQSPS